MDTVTLDKCPACSAGAFDVLPQPGHWIGNGIFDGLRKTIGLMKCRQCGLRFTNPRPDEAALGVFYSGDTYTCHESLGSASAGSKAEFLLDKIEESFPQGGTRTLLDFGCGGGGFLHHAIRRNWRGNGFEPGRRGREVCTEAGLNVTGKIESLPSDFFGVVTLHHVFEHVDDHRSVLDQIKRVLNPDGRLFIEVPNAQSLRARLSPPFMSRHMGFDERYRAFPIHLSYFNRNSLSLLLRRAGWEITREFTVGMGIEVLISRSPATSGPAKTSTGSSASSPIRRALKRAIYDSGLGENLCLIARPLAP